MPFDIEPTRHPNGKDLRLTARSVTGGVLAVQSIDPRATVGEAIVALSLVDEQARKALGTGVDPILFV